MISAVLALDYHLSEKIEIVLVGSGPIRGAMLSELHSRFIPNRIVAVSEDGGSALPLFEGRHTYQGEVVAYVCRNSVCGIPAETVEDLKKQLQKM